MRSISAVLTIGLCCSSGIVEAQRAPVAWRSTAKNSLFIELGGKCRRVELQHRSKAQSECHRATCLRKVQLHRATRSTHQALQDVHGDDQRTRPGTDLVA